MLSGEILQVAFQAIVANKLRSFLTMLGIVIGVGAVITMVALGTGAQRAVEDQIQRLGTDLLSVYAGQSFRRGVASQDRVSLTTDDADALRRDGYALKAVVPELSRNQQVKYGNRNINVNVLATTADYPEVNNYDIEAGSMFTYGDDDSRRRVAVLGFGVPDMLETNGAAMIGQQISIRGIPFEIIGILAEKGAQGFSNPDEQILVPLKTGQFRVFGTDRLRSINVQVLHPDSMNVAMIGIERVLPPTWCSVLGECTRIRPRSQSISCQRRPRCSLGHRSPPNRLRANRSRHSASGQAFNTSSASSRRTKWTRSGLARVAAARSANSNAATTGPAQHRHTDRSRWVRCFIALSALIGWHGGWRTATGRE